MTLTMATKSYIVLGYCAAALMLSPSVLGAQENNNACHSVKADLERLACYDAQSNYTDADKVAAPKPVVNLGRQWRKEEEKSSLENRTDVWLSVTSENSQPNQIGSPEKARLWVRCMNNSTNVFVTFNDYTSDNQNVRYKLDNESVRKIWMVHMQGGDGIGIWSGGKAIPLIKSFYGAEKLVLAYESYTNMNLEFTFNISGLRERIGPLAESCHWQP